MNDAAHPDSGLDPGEVRLVVVGPEWALRFASERERLCTALGAAAIDIQHVGSTAVPGIHAKPILDIAVAIRSFEDGDALVPVLEGLGYEYRGEHGIARRHYFVRGTPRRTQHLHMLEEQGSDWERHLRFRDRLLGSPDMAARYSELKLANVAASGGNRDQYQALKAAFVTRTLGQDPPA